MMITTVFRNSILYTSAERVIVGLMGEVENALKKVFTMKKYLSLNLYLYGPQYVGNYELLNEDSTT